jgi:hypothetical protein
MWHPAGSNCSDVSRRAQLDDIPEVELDRLAKLGFDWVSSVFDSSVSQMRVLS